MEHDTYVLIHFLRNMDDKESEAKREGMMPRKPTERQQGDINKLADAFISNFGKQLTYQRDEPIKYYQEMKA
ncbi:Protein of unknown function DUF761 [Theobroma cacao]|nr:Protein of unknown function DUF761 [Theobroma cacao]